MVGDDRAALAPDRAFALEARYQRYEVSIMGSGPYSVWPVMRECRRIGVDMNRMPGLAHGGGLSPEDFIRWMRTIPGGSGHDEFVRRLGLPVDQGGPHAPGPDESEVADVATFVDPEIDAQIALHDELRRVIPPETLSGPQGEARLLAFAAFDSLLAGDAGQTAAALRALPDGAGLRAALRAVKSPRLA